MPGRRAHASADVECSVSGDRIKRQAAHLDSLPQQEPCASGSADDHATGSLGEKHELGLERACGSRVCDYPQSTLAERSRILDKVKLFGSGMAGVCVCVFVCPHVCL